jgi:Phage tail tube protein, GTA-gp10
MAVNGEVELTWGDGEHKFNIAKLKCILELEDKCGVGVAEIYQRISTGKWRYNDIRETLRLGLIGAGMTPDKASRLINRYCDDRPWTESLLTAQAVLVSAMVGVPGDDFEKKTKADRSTDDPSFTPTADSSAPPSTDSVPPLDSIHDN